MTRIQKSQVQFPARMNIVFLELRHTHSYEARGLIIGDVTHL